jgi:PhnB protein
MNTVNHIPDGFHSITPYLILKDCAAAIKFYQHAFGAKELERVTLPGGVIAHAALQIGDAQVMLAEEGPQWKTQSPAILGGSGVGIVLYVPDVDATFQRALNAGARQVDQVKDMFYGDRAGMLTDPFGHNWHIMTHIEDVTSGEVQRRFDTMLAQGK